MAKTTFDVGDQFSFTYGPVHTLTGFGIVLPDNLALVVKNLLREGSQTLRSITRQPIPESALPVEADSGSIPRDVSDILYAVGTALRG